MADLSSLQNFQFRDEEVTYNKRDLILYALGIGMGQDGGDLKYTYELQKGFEGFPTYGLVLPLKGPHRSINSYAERSMKSWDVPGMPKIDLRKLVHGEQSYTLLLPSFPLPTSPEEDVTLTLRSKISAVYDLGKAMLIVSESFLLLPNGEKLVRMVSSAFVIGGGGFGGPPPPPRVKSTFVTPKKGTVPTFEITKHIPKNQAQLYRLSGDYNPLHIDPSIGKAMGMKGVILHGLSSLGMAASALVGVVEKMEGGGDWRFEGISCRFASPVYPGDTLQTQIWAIPSPSTTSLTFTFTCLVGGKEVLSGGVSTFLRKIKKGGSGAGQARL